MPKLVRLYIVHCALGFAISALFLGLVLAIDVAGLRHLVLATPSGWIAALIFFLSNGILFAGVQFAIAVMSLAEPQGNGPRRGIRQQVRLATALASAPERRA